MTININTLFSVRSFASLLNVGLGVAQAAGLVVTSWRTGDPTLSQFKFLATVLSQSDSIVASFIRAGFLSTSQGDWKTVVAREMYGVDRTEATFATPTVTLQNVGGGFYVLEPGDVTVKASATNATYHSTSGPLDPTTLAPLTALSAGVTALFQLTADEAGSASSAAVNEIDTLISSLLKVNVVSSTAAVGLDAQDDTELDAECNGTLGPLSSNGPADAYVGVCLNPKLTGVLDINRAVAIDDSDTGDVTIYVASASGTASGPSVAACLAAVTKWATPLGHTPTVLSATALPIAVTGTLEGVLPADYLATSTAALGVLFAALPICGADPEDVATSLITAAIHAQIAAITGVNLSAPAANVTLSTGQVPTLGVVTLTPA
jgi:hypothetical protein